MLLRIHNPINLLFSRWSLCSGRSCDDVSYVDPCRFEFCEPFDCKPFARTPVERR
jgi:hypothetical protein